MFELVSEHNHNIKTGFPITQSVIDGSQAGQIYCEGESMFVIHRSGLTSIVADSGKYANLASLFCNTEIPKYFHIYNAADELISTISNLPDVFNFKVRSRIQLEYRRRKHVEAQVPENFFSADASALNFSSLSSLGLDLESRFWTSKEAFLLFSNAVIVYNSDGEPVSICYAAAIADGKAEVDVYTATGYRGKGLAFMAVGKFINRCIIQGIVPHWDCFSDNYSSLGIAKKFGFEVKREYKFLSIFKK